MEQTFTAVQCPVVRASVLAPGMIQLALHCPEIAAQAGAGQFLHIKAEGFFLRRPISICEIDRKRGEVSIVFQSRGEGTRVLAAKKPGDTLDLLGPLGNGFDVSDTAKKAIFVGGGIGVPPLLEAAHGFGWNATVLLGFQSAKQTILTEAFMRNGHQVLVTTDDGSIGEKGFVTDVLTRLLERQKYDIIYSCGPMPMLERVAAIAQSHSIRCQVSLEERMGCGVGACVGCACKIRTQSGEQYRRVCKDGPVFEAQEVVFGG